MSLITDIVVSSAAAAFAHFGLTLDVPEREPARVERTVARVPVRKAQPAAQTRDEDCTEPQAQVVRV